MTISPATRVFAILGDPVAHSLSPAMHNAALAAAGIDAVYTALRCTPAEFPGLLAGLARAGGGGNVTVPHKRLAAALVEKPSAAVEQSGACNTFWLEDGVIHGDNTDVVGFAAALRTFLGSPAGIRVLLLGAGGAARGALYSLLQEHVDTVVLLNRTTERAEEMAAAVGASRRRVRVAKNAAALRREGFDLVVNATSLGLHPEDPAPIALDALHRVGAVLDLVYARGGTPWVNDARRLSIPAADGTEMLLHQAAEAFRLWFRSEPDLEVMRTALGRPV